jgi:DNA modification methylase
VTYTLHCGDCLDVMRGMDANSVDTVITDPPYGLSDHNPQAVIDCLRSWLDGDAYHSDKKGFMGKAWDAWVPGPDVWRECLRVLKPGGMMLVFAGTRSMDLMSLAIRLAGLELRDSIGYAHDGGGAPLMAWTYGQGFPKSLAIDKALERAIVAEIEKQGYEFTGWADE